MYNTFLFSLSYNNINTIIIMSFGHVFLDNKNGSLTHDLKFKRILSSSLQHAPAPNSFRAFPRLDFDPVCEHSPY